MFVSRPGHQTWTLARAFMRTIPGWPTCNSSKTRACSGRGITTRMPHNKQFSSTVISLHLLKYGFIASLVTSVGHPVKAYSNTLDKIGSDRVALQTWSTETGNDSSCNWWISWTLSCSFRTWSLSGNRDKQSAFACLCVDRYSISYWYPDKSKAHLCILAAANVGIPVFGSSKLTSGLWSVTKINFRP